MEDRDIALAAFILMVVLAVRSWCADVVLSTNVNYMTWTTNDANNLVASFAATSAPAAWTPADMTTLLWLRSDSGVDVQGTNVFGWQDKSGHAYNVTQATAAAQPYYQTNAINGYPALKFRGSTGASSGAGSALTNVMAFVNGTGSTNFSVFLVYATIGVPASSDGANYGMFGSGAAATAGIRWLMSSGGSAAQHNGWHNSAASNFGAGAGVTNAWTVRAYWQLNKAWTVRESGSNVFGWVTETASTPGPYRAFVGGEAYQSYALNGYIAEVIVADAPLTSNDVEKIEGYAAWHYGFQAQLNDSHPYKAAAP